MGLGLDLPAGLWGLQADTSPKGWMDEPLYENLAQPSVKLQPSWQATQLANSGCISLVFSLPSALYQ